MGTSPVSFGRANVSQDGTASGYFVIRYQAGTRKRVSQKMICRTARTYEPVSGGK